MSNDRNRMPRSSIVRVCWETVILLKRWWQMVEWLTMRPGRHDPVLSIILTSGMLTLWPTPVAAQVGVSGAEQVLCAEGINLAQLVTLGLGLMSMYFILKFFLRAMTGLDTRGEVIATRDPVVDRRKKRRYGKLQTRDSLYSLGAALLPLFVPVFLNVVGIDVVSCLFP